MDWLTFFSIIIKSLAWPVAATVIVVVLRRRIAELLQNLGGRLTSAEGAGVKLTFTERVEKLEEVVVPEIALSAQGDFSAQGEVIPAHPMSGQPPAYIVSQAWLRLEQALRETVKPVGTRGLKRPAPIMTLVVYWAKDQGLLTDDELPVIKTLLEMRNLATHSVDPDITLTDALRYWDIADTLIQKLKERRGGQGAR